MPEPFRINETGAVCRMYIDPTQWNIQPKQQRAPQEVNGYLLSYVIGSGAYSKVRLAVQRGTGQKVGHLLVNWYLYHFSTVLSGGSEDNTETT